MSASRDNPAEFTDGSDARRLAERLRQAREYLGLSQEAVAEYLDIPRPAVSSIENGTRKVSSLELKRLAELYRRPIAYFLDDEAAEPVLRADKYTGALFRVVTNLSDTDREQVLKFAEFLRQGPPPHRAPQ
jgi:transcriptional regulator with XRE-family HTH domain